MVPDFGQLTFPVRGHTIITTSMDEDSVYLIGGLSTQHHIMGTTEIYKLQNVCDPDLGDVCASNGTKLRFKAISTQLQFGRAYHIALPISYELAKESCQGKGYLQ